MLKHVAFIISSLIIGSSAASDLTTVTTRRYSELVGEATGATSIPTWLSTLGSDGSWPDVDYTTGCNAQNSSWPAQKHWERINTFSAAWHGGFKNALNYSGDPNIRSSISLAMAFWFDNDFTIPACIDSGGTSACPCGTPGFWNENWDANIILIPTWVAGVCLLLEDSLTSSELAGCQTVNGRAYNTFNTGIVGVSNITGANTLDIANIGIDHGLATSNLSLVTEAYGRIHAEVTVKNGVKVDGIRADGSFGQHSGILYNGNYGRDYQNDVFDLEIAAANTEFQADDASRDAFITLLTADKWMTFYNTITGVVHWDFSVLGRYISLPVLDNQSSASIKTNVTQVQVLADEWGSDELQDVFDDWSSSPSTANVGSLNGNNMFFANDYMVQRGSGYVTTLKMYSTRTQNTECTNSMNPFGFHLSDGTLYTYITGDEYEDIFASWDWNLIPGITVDYNGSPLNCTGARHTGTQTFVGGASDGEIGIAAMRYETPSSKALNWRKTWFFLPNDVQFVMVAKITSTNPVPVFSVLDQRKHVGNVYVSGKVQSSGNYTGATSLWHGSVGYVFNTSDPTTLSIQIGERTGSWQDIGTSVSGPTTVDLFAAWLNHTDTTASISYAIYPATSSFSSFQAKAKASNLQSIRNDGSISALVDINNSVAMLAYWVAAGGSVTIPTSGKSGVASLKVTADGNSLVIIHLDTWEVTLSDPTQSLSTVTLSFALGSGTVPSGWTGSSTKNLTFSLPNQAGGFAGQSVTMPLN